VISRNFMFHESSNFGYSLKYVAKHFKNESWKSRLHLYFYPQKYRKKLENLFSCYKMRTCLFDYGQWITKVTTGLRSWTIFCNMINNSKYEKQTLISNILWNIKFETPLSIFQCFGIFTFWWDYIFCESSKLCFGVWYYSIQDSRIH